MKDNFLTEFYNTIIGFFRQTEKKEEEQKNAKEVACNRLRVVLMQDRTNLTPELQERMRIELVDLLSKYVEMDREALELSFEPVDGQMALMLSIPVLRAREEAEIIATLSEEDLKDEEDITEETHAEEVENLDEEIVLDEEISEEHEEVLQEDSSEELTNESEDKKESEEEIKE